MTLVEVRDIVRDTHYTLAYFGSDLDVQIPHHSSDWFCVYRYNSNAFIAVQFIECAALEYRVYAHSQGGNITRSFSAEDVLALVLAQ